MGIGATACPAGKMRELVTGFKNGTFSFFSLSLSFLFLTYTPLPLVVFSGEEPEREHCCHNMPPC